MSPVCGIFVAKCAPFCWKILVRPIYAFGQCQIFGPLWRQARALGEMKILKNVNHPFKYPPPAPPALPAPPAPPACPAPSREAQVYTVIFIPDYGCFRLAEQILGQKLRFFVSLEFF